MSLLLEFDFGLGIVGLVALLASFYLIHGLLTSIVSSYNRRGKSKRTRGSFSSLLSQDLGAQTPTTLVDPAHVAASQLPQQVFYKTYVPYVKDEDFALEDFDIVPRVNHLMAAHQLHDVADLLDHVLVVDCSHPTAMTLTHHRNNPRCPSHLRGDSSGDTVFNAIHARHPALKLPLVTANHFDLDALVSVFAASAVNPDASGENYVSSSLALRHEELLRQVSKVGDFRELAPENPTALEATKICCWVNTVERREFYRPFDGDESEGAPAKFDYFLPRLPAVLANVAAFEADWRVEYDQVMAGVRQLQESAVIQKYPELGLVVISTTEPIHYYALFSVTHGYDVVLSMYQGQRYELEFKYTGYVEVVSRPVLPRVDPAKLLEKLNDLEEPIQPDLYWNGSRITDSGPIVRLDRKGIKLNKVERYGNPTERPIYASSLPQTDMASLVKSYFAHAYKDVKAKTPWTWSEIHKFNRTINWDAWPAETSP